jgi:hypothetical protein
MRLGMRRSGRDRGAARSHRQGPSGDTALERQSGCEDVDVGVRRLGGPWRTLAKAVGEKSMRVDGVPRTQMQARVRARDTDGVPGPWSDPRSFRL